MGKQKSEFGLIEWIRQQRNSPQPGVITDIGDDMAVVEVGSEKLLITTDMLLEGIHFTLDDKNADVDLDRRKEHGHGKPATLRQVGYKAMACSLSDCAAMAAVP